MIDNCALFKCFSFCSVEIFTCTCYSFRFIDLTHHAEQFSRVEGRAVAIGSPTRPKQVKVMQQGQGKGNTQQQMDKSAWKRMAERRRANSHKKRD